MSAIGHPAGASGLTVALGPAEGFDWHDHPQHQLAVAISGVVTVSLDGAAWVLPPSRALWIPAGTRHAVAADGAATLGSVYLDPVASPGGPAAPTAMVSTELVRGLVVHLDRSSLAPDQRRRAGQVLLDALSPLAVDALPLPEPRDDRARRVAEELRSDPADARTLRSWGHAVGASERTLARLFADETGLTFSRWRTHVRLAAALPHLARGEPIDATAHAVGYSAPSAFVAAFRRELGTTPRRYFD